MYNVEEKDTEEIDIGKELKKFNFGAFALGPVWAIFNGALASYGLWFILSIICITLLKHIPFFGFIFIVIGGIGIPVYVGLKGNEWAWYGKKWDDIKAFNKTQINWATGGAIVFVICIISIFVAIYGIMNTGVKMIKEEGGVLKFTHQFTIKLLVKSPDWLNSKSGEEFVIKSLKTDPTLKRFNADTVIVNSSKGEKIIMTFYKDGDCDLEKKNCYIMSYCPDHESDIAVKTYFDKNGKTDHLVLKDFEKPEPDSTDEISEEYIEENE